ncbi:hypothetical protein OEZ85_009185 [Tetradesmus obliquus]|uniref:Uncharacterized protein n=1 Tax=Tetradesmus obliquus TaxID=3088 RepID=A0ABY8TLE0_TETOB|nr:hypothetical protein OEZ85_009185 [Tetradesmus obliquus]
MHSSSSDMPPDMSTSGTASSNEGQLQQQQDMADLGEARPGAVPNPDAAAMADSNVGSSPSPGSSSSSSGGAGMRDASDANPGVTPNPDAAALADRNVGQGSTGAAGPAGSMGVQDRAPATVLPSSGSMADRVAQGMAEASSPGSTPDDKTEPAKVTQQNYIFSTGSDPGIAGGL